LNILDFIKNSVLKPETLEEKIAHEVIEFFAYGEVYSRIKKELEG